MPHPFTFSIFKYHGKTVISIHREDRGIGSIELQDYESGLRDFIIEFIDKLNEKYKELHADKGGEVR